MKKSINPMMLRLRLYRPDGNPLRRHSDRLESAYVLAVMLLMLVSVWPAVVAGQLAYERAVREELATFGARHQVMATLLEDAPVARVSFTEIPAGRPIATAHWRTTTGEERTAQVPVPALAKAGSTVAVWIDDSGTPVPPPTGPEVLQMRGVATGMLIVLLTGLLVLGSFAGLRRRMNTARYRDWELAWERADEKWRRRREV